MSKTQVQKEMIEQVRRLCHQDTRITAALMYGSLSRGEGDEFSDIEFFIFIDNADSLLFNQAQWVGKIAPMAFYFVSHLGHGRAVFQNLIRGEFHFQKASEMASVQGFKSMVSVEDPDAMIILDRTGELRRHLNYLVAKPGAPSTRDRVTRERLLWQCRSLLYTMLSGFNLLARNERVHALDLLCIVQRFLLPLVLAQEEKLRVETRGYKNFMNEVSGPTYERYIACTGSLHGDSLERAYWEAWVWGKEIMENLRQKNELHMPQDIVRALDARFTALLESKLNNFIPPGKSS